MFDFPSELTYEHFEQMFNLEREFYDEEFITPASEAHRWYVIHPHSVVAVFHEDQVAGFINLFPVRHELFQEIASGRFNDANLEAEDIMPLEALRASGASYDLFLSCIVVGVQYRGMGLIRKLVQEAVKLYAPYEALLDNVVVDTVTPDGFRFAQKLGFTFIGESDHDSCIHTQTFQEFLAYVQ